MRNVNRAESARRQLSGDLRESRYTCNGRGFRRALKSASAKLARRVNRELCLAGY
jgi:hypothetical protein